jgi:hypothetical protein
MNNKIVFFSFILILCQLFSGCAVPLAFVGLYSTPREDFSENNQIPDENENENTFEIDYSIGIVLENMDENGNAYIYAGEYNSLRIFIPDETDPMNVELKSSAGTIERTETDSTLFRLYVKEPGLSVEVTAKDTVTGTGGLFYGESVEYPLPQACLNLIENGEMDLENFKKQGQIMLKYKNEKNPKLCKCLGFIITRISPDAKKESVKNDGEAFTTNTKNLISKAQKGDYFIFDEIKVQCTANTEPRKLRSLVYNLK